MSDTPRYDALRERAITKPLDHEALDVWAALKDAERELAGATAANAKAAEIILRQRGEINASREYAIHLAELCEQAADALAEAGRPFTADVLRGKVDALGKKPSTGEGSGAELTATRSGATGGVTVRLGDPAGSGAESAPTNSSAENAVNSAPDHLKHVVCVPDEWGVWWGPFDSNEAAAAWAEERKIEKCAFEDMVSPDRWNVTGDR